MMVLVKWDIFSNGPQYVGPLVPTDIFYPPDGLLYWLLLPVRVESVNPLQGLLHLPVLQGLQDGRLESLARQVIPLQQSGVAVSLSSQQIGFLVVHEWNPNQSLELSIVNYARAQISRPTRY